MKYSSKYSAGVVVSRNDEFSCLVNGDASSPKYIGYSSIDDGINDSNTVRNEVCEAPTPVRDTSETMTFLKRFGEMCFRRDVDQDLNDLVVLVLLHAHMIMIKHRKLYYYWMTYHWIKLMDVTHLFKV